MTWICSNLLPDHQDSLVGQHLPRRSDQIFWQSTVYFSTFSQRLAPQPRRTSSSTLASSNSRETKAIASACSSGFFSPWTIKLRRIFKARMDFSNVISAPSFCPSRKWDRRVWEKRRRKKIIIDNTSILVQKFVVLTWCSAFQSPNKYPGTWGNQLQDLNNFKFLRWWYRYRFFNLLIPVGKMIKIGLLSVLPMILLQRSWKARLSMANRLLAKALIVWWR